MVPRLRNLALGASIVLGIQDIHSVTTHSLSKHWLDDEMTE